MSVTDEQTNEAIDMFTRTVSGAKAEGMSHDEVLVALFASITLALKIELNAVWERLEKLEAK